MCCGISWLHFRPAPPILYYFYDLWLRTSHHLGFLTKHIPWTLIVQMAVPSADMCTGPWQWAGGLSDRPMLTFRLTVVEYPSQFMIPTVDNRWVSSSFNTFTVELLFHIILI